MKKVILETSNKVSLGKINEYTPLIVYKNDTPCGVISKKDNHYEVWFFTGSAIPADYVGRLNAINACDYLGYRVVALGCGEVYIPENNDEHEINLHDIPEETPIFVKKNKKLVGLICLESDSTGWRLSTGSESLFSNNYTRLSCIKKCDSMGYEFYIEE